MARKTIKRRSVKRITVAQNVRCQRIIPVEASQNTPCAARHSARWMGKTISFHLTKEQAIHLARVLLAATQEWDEIDITAFRFQRRTDGTYPVTVTSIENPEED